MARGAFGRYLGGDNDLAKVVQDLLERVDQSAVLARKRVLEQRRIGQAKDVNQ